jgi:hypothetical protein
MLLEHSRFWGCITSRRAPQQNRSPEHSMLDLTYSCWQGENAGTAAAPQRWHLRMDNRRPSCAHHAVHVSTGAREFCVACGGACRGCLKPMAASSIFASTFLPQGSRNTRVRDGADAGSSHSNTDASWAWTRGASYVAGTRSAIHAVGS